MILVAGLSPAWQHILVMDAVRRGEVNRANDAVWCSSGKVTNVSLAINSLGGDLRTLTVLGGGNGESIRHELDAAGVPLHVVPCDAETRVCTTVIESNDGTITEYVENARPISHEEFVTFMTAFADEVGKADVAVLTGSIPPGVPSEMFGECLKRASSNAKFVLDIRGHELLHALPLRPFLVKPNREELARTVERELNSEGEMISAMRELNARGAEWVLISNGRGPLLLTSTSEQFRFHPLAVDVVNPIGCGDCLAAGIAYGLDQGMKLPDAIKLGVAAAAENAEQILPSRLNLERVEDLAKTVRVERGTES